MVIRFIRISLIIYTEIRYSESFKQGFTLHLTDYKKKFTFYLESPYAFITPKKKPVQLILFPKEPYILQSKWTKEP